MKRIFLVLLALTAITVNAQNHLIGMKGGVNCSNISNSPRVDFNFKIGFAGGLTYDFLFKKYFSTGIDLIYEQDGASIHNITMYDTERQPHIVDIQYDYAYIWLPVKIGFNYGNKLYGFLNIGITPSFLVKSKENIIINEYQTSTVNGIESTSKFNISGFAEIGGGYKFNDRYFVFMSLLYHHSIFSHVRYGMIYDYLEMRHYGFTANVGVKYALTK